MCYDFLPRSGTQTNVFPAPLRLRAMQWFKFDWFVVSPGVAGNILLLFVSVRVRLWLIYLLVISS